MKILVVADPLEKLRPKSDTSLALVHAALGRSHRVDWAIADAVEVNGEQVLVESRPVDRCEKDALPGLGKENWKPLSDWDVVFVRKDPPFDSSYVKLCWLLALEEKRVWMLNRPSCLLRYHEKMLPLEAAAQGFLKLKDLIGTHIGRLSRAKAFVSGLPARREIVVKPFLGFGGGSVQRTRREAFLEMSQSQFSDSLVQPFQDAIATHGDRRVFFLEGKRIGDFVRLPPKGGFVSNLAQGGTAEMRAMSAADKEVAGRVGKFLKKAGIVFAGADMIGPLVSEINITSPTGLRKLEEFTGHDYALDIVVLMEKRVKRTR